MKIIKVFTQIYDLNFESLQSIYKSKNVNIYKIPAFFIVGLRVIKRKPLGSLIILEDAQHAATDLCFFIIV